MRSTNNRVADRIAALKSDKSRGEPGFTNALLEGLKDRSPAVRSEAVLLIEAHRLMRLIPQVKRLLSDESREVRYDAAGSLATLLKKRKTPQSRLRTLLTDQSSLVRAQAAESLALIGDRGALPGLFNLLSDREPFVRAYAASAIGELRGFRYKQNLYNAALSERNETARRGILEALFVLGEKSVFADFLTLLESSDYHVRCSIANALQQIPLNRTEVQAAIYALARASRRPLEVADGSATRRALRELKMTA